MTADNLPELLPCPFCGAGAAVVGGKFPPLGDRFGTECSGCGVWRDDRAHTKAEAIAAWNTRASPPERQGMELFDNVISPAILGYIQHGVDELIVRRIWDSVRRGILATPVPAPSVGWSEMALNVGHPDCHKAADAFWKYWRENGETHKHGYYESTWGAINCALRTVGVTSHQYLKPRPCPVCTGRAELQHAIDVQQGAYDD